MGVLITGATGFIGSAIVEELLAAGLVLARSAASAKKPLNLSVSRYYMVLSMISTA